MTSLSRRRFLAAAALSTAATVTTGTAFAQATPRVVVVGGGFGGASVARWLKRSDPGIAVTLIERSAQFVTCPLSNLVLAGLREISSISFGYDGVRRAGIDVVQAEVLAIDPVARRVTVGGGGQFPFDRLVLAPGIRLVRSAITGYDEAASELMPHAWMAGPQTVLLRRRIQSMEDGGLVVIAAPDNPARCPPSPYERASLIAWYLRSSKPRSKIMILDSKDAFPMQGLFLEAWKALYGDMIEWVPRSQGGHVTSVNPATGLVTTEFDDFNSSVANIIPPQRCGQIATTLGLDEGRGYCSVNPYSFESVVTPNVHLIGDAILGGAMPKSGFAANSQARACAGAVVSLLRGKAPEETALHNACYSTVAPDYGFTTGGAYRPNEQGLMEIPGTARTSPLGAPSEFRAAEARYAESWYRDVTADMFG